MDILRDVMHLLTHERQTSEAFKVVSECETCKYWFVKNRFVVHIVLY